MSKQKRRYPQPRLAAVFAVCSIIIVAVTWFFSARRQVDIELRGVGHSTASDVQELECSLHGRLVVERIRGHADSPFGTSGRNYYWFDGVVRIESQDYTLTTEGFEPLAVFKYRNKKFVLLTEHFHRGTFLWKMCGSNGRLIDTTPDVIPFELRLIRFKDLTTTYLFRAWNLNSLSDADTQSVVCRLLDAYVSENARFAYSPEEWRGTSGERRTELLRFLSTQVRLLDCDAGYSSLVQMLEASVPTDDPQIISRIGYGIYRTNPIEGREILCRYLEMVQREGHEDDMRKLALEEPEGLARVIDCE